MIKEVIYFVQKPCVGTFIAFLALGIRSSQHSWEALESTESQVLKEMLNQPEDWYLCLMSWGLSVDPQTIFTSAHWLELQGVPTSGISCIMHGGPRNCVVQSMDVNHMAICIKCCIVSRSWQLDNNCASELGTQNICCHYVPHGILVHNWLAGWPLWRIPLTGHSCSRGIPANDVHQFCTPLKGKMACHVHCMHNFMVYPCGPDVNSQMPVQIRYKDV